MVNLEGLLDVWTQQNAFFSIQSKRSNPIVRAKMPGVKKSGSWSGLPIKARHAIREWTNLQMGGRHCLLIIEECTERVSSDDGENTLRTLASLNASISGRVLYDKIFSKKPKVVVQEAFERARIEAGAECVSAPELALAFRRMRLRAADQSSAPITALMAQVWAEVVHQSLGNEPPVDVTDLLEWNDAELVKLLESDSAPQDMTLDLLRWRNQNLEEYVVKASKCKEQIKQLIQKFEEMDAYVILGLQGPDATNGEVKKAYRALARNTHPDKGGDRQRFQKIQEAYNSVVNQRGLELTADDLSARGDDSAPARFVTVFSEIASKRAEEARHAADQVAQKAHDVLSLTRSGAKAEIASALEAVSDCSEMLLEVGKHSEAVATQAKAIIDSPFAQEVRDQASGVALADRTRMCTDACDSTIVTSECLIKIKAAVAQTLEKVEKVQPLSERSGNAGGRLPFLANKVSQGSVRRLAMAASKAATESIQCASKVSDLASRMQALVRELQTSKPRPAQAPTTDGDGSESTAYPDMTPRAESHGFGSQSQSPQGLRGKKALKAAEDRVLERHLALWDKNWHFLKTLNDEVQRLLAQLRSLLARNPHSLPRLTVAEKQTLFQLLTELIEYTLARTIREPREPPRRALHWLLHFQYVQLAMHTDVRTQILLVAVMVDAELAESCIRCLHKRLSLACRGMKMKILDGICEEIIQAIRLHAGLRDNGVEG
eukprot:GEMP01011000.1.p1 GENE.GEMP01011000.1~~GEMP01011000.1.p1  ORF type:complete len:809 (+),score=177.49 GEMP01011000.1:271-2427(+)